MLPTFIEIENILKTLPVGYYIGRNVPVKLTNEQGSYYMPMLDEICISYPMLANVMVKIEDKLNERNIEGLTRTLLYHEISHAFITPPRLSMSRIMNVFEDERIESICRTYYKGVNFKQLLMLVNDWDGKTEPAHDSAFSVWYSLFRYHLGKHTHVIKAAALLKKYTKLNRFSDYWNCRCCEDEVLAFYREIEDEFNEEKAREEAERQARENEENNSGTGNTDESEQDEGENESSEPASVGANEEAEEDEELSEDERRQKEFEEMLGQMTDEQIEELFENIASIKHEETKELFENAQIFVDEGIQERLANIILANKKVTKSNASAINAYSGVFDPRSVVRQDYKWFVQQNRQGNVKQFAKIKLNLFIDNSGSFEDNELIVNKLLFALRKLEQQEPNFSFDVVTMNTEFKLKKKNERTLKCGGGNDVPDYAGELIKKVQDRQSMNYNIVLFDGDALSDDYKKRNRKNFKFFDMPNTVMILENSNKEYANENCKSTKRIYTRDYANELIDQVCVALTFLLK